MQRVTDIIGEIRAATSEQSQGIAQVNTAVNQLDQMTQQNSALVEESTAAADSLREQAVKLTQVVALFRVNGNASGHPGAAPPAPATAHRPSPSPAPRPAAASAVRAAAPRPALGKPTASGKAPAARSAPTARAPVAALPSAASSNKKSTPDNNDDWESF